MNTRALHHISYGMYVIGSKKDDKINGQIANTVIQTSSEPPTLSVCINKSNLSHDYIRSGKVFTVSILSRDTPLNFIGRFGFKSGREFDKFDGINYRIGETGAPIVLDNALAYLEAKVIGEFDVGTHTDFWGELVNAEVLQEGEPMTYAYYHLVKRGTTPKTAPSFIKDEEKKEIPNVKRYRCTVCGYIYDPKEGDPDGGIKPGTAFEDIPEDWVCPVCGAAKSEFEELAD